MNTVMNTLGKRAALCVFGVLVLTGCSHIPAPSMDEMPQQYTSEQLAQFEANQKALQRMSHWAIKARGAVRDGSEGGSFALHWVQIHDRSEVDLSGPFGQGQMYLAGTPDYMAIGHDPEQMRYTAAPEHWLEENTGWPIPIAALPAWLIGKADAPMRDEQVQINADGLIVQQYAAGWQIRYDRYNEQYNPPLPGLVEVTRDDLRLRILIDHWDLQTPAKPHL